MSRKKSHLQKRKNQSSGADIRRAASKALSRRLHNASCKYGLSVNDLQACHVKLISHKLLHNHSYQHFEYEGMSRVMCRPIIFSAYDGISAGYLAMDGLGIKPFKYFSSEINEDCLKIQRFNLGNKICQLGDITQITYDTLKCLGPVNIVFGGSPCDQLSAANPNRKGLDDESGTGPLFYQFVKIMAYFRNLAILENRENQFFWFFENVASMSLEDRCTITRYLGCQPVIVDSVSFVPMKRKRLIWTNIAIPEVLPNQLRSSTVQSASAESLQNYLIGSGRTAAIDVLPTVTTNRANLVKGGVMPVADVSNGPSHIYLSEIEKLFGFPINYTAGPDTPLYARLRVLGKTWDIHTIQHILKGTIPALLV